MDQITKKQVITWAQQYEGYNVDLEIRGKGMRIDRMHGQLYLAYDENGDANGIAVDNIGSPYDTAEDNGLIEFLFPIIENFSSLPYKKIGLIKTSLFDVYITAYDLPAFEDQPLWGETWRISDLIKSISEKAQQSWNNITDVQQKNEFLNNHIDSICEDFKEGIMCRWSDIMDMASRDFAQELENEGETHE